MSECCLGVWVFFFSFLPNQPPVLTDGQVCLLLMIFVNAVGIFLRIFKKWNSGWIEGKGNESQQY